MQPDPAAPLATHETGNTAAPRPRSMEAIGSVAGGMAHDFNNLLSVIILNLDHVNHLLDEADERKACVNEALEAATRGAELIRSLLAFARRQALNPVCLNLNDVVSGMRRPLSLVLGNAIGISLDLAPDIWPVAADRAQVEASLVNLATNALDAMPQGGRVVISTRNRRLDAGDAAPDGVVRPGDYAMVAVSDSGVGMAPDLMADIFEPFFSTKPHGSGLGLSTVSGFADQSGGHASASSTPGQGTTVRLFLPKVSGDPAEAPEAPEAVYAPSAGSHAQSWETILVVEDNPAVRRVVAHELGALGYRVVEADTPRAALAMLEAQSVSLVFTDVAMPGPLDGFDLRQVVLQRWPWVPVLLTSGFAGSLDGHRPDRRMPAVRLLCKPYHRTDLAQAVRDALEGCPKGVGPKAGGQEAGEQEGVRQTEAAA